MFDSFEMKPQACPACGYLMDRSAPITGTASPEEGDVSICFHCSAINLFDAAGALHLASDEELRLLQEHRGKWATIVEAQRLIRTKL